MLSNNRYHYQDQSYSSVQPSLKTAMNAGHTNKIFFSLKLTQDSILTFTVYAYDIYSIFFSIVLLTMPKLNYLTSQINWKIAKHKLQKIDEQRTARDTIMTRKLYHFQIQKIKQRKGIYEQMKTYTINEHNRWTNEYLAQTNT